MAALIGVACRTGGPDANRRVDVDGGAERDAVRAAADTAAVLTGGPRFTGGGDAAADGGITDGAIADVGPASDAETPPPTDNGCVPPVESSGCDPVCNTGCEALTRCNVTDQPRTGRCIGIWISGEGDLCLKTDITDPCAAHLACVEGACRRLCYRDSDCASPGTCCGQGLLLDGQASGYKICVACPR